MRVQLRIDDNPPLQPARAHGVWSATSGRLQGGLELLPDAALDDGLLDVVVVAPRTLARLDAVGVAGSFAAIARSTRTSNASGAARSVIEADRIVPRQMDGEVIDDGRSLHARIEPGALGHPRASSRWRRPPDEGARA